MPSEIPMEVPTVSLPTNVPEVDVASSAPVSLFLSRDGDLEVYVVDHRGLRFGDRTLAIFDDGLSRGDDRRGQLLTDLYDHALERAEEAKSLRPPNAEPYEGDVLLAIDPTIPFQTIREVMYTLGQAQFGHFYFLVEGPQVQIPPVATRRGFGRIDLGVGDPVRSQPGRDLPWREQSLAELSPYIAAVAPDCTIVTPSTATSMADIATVMSTLYAHGTPRVVIAGGVEDVPVRARKQITFPGTRPVALDAHLPVVHTKLPRLMEPGVYAPCSVSAERAMRLSSP